MFRQGFHLFEGGFPFLGHGGISKGESGLLGVAAGSYMTESFEKFDRGRGRFSSGVEVAVLEGYLVPDCSNVFGG